MHTIMSTINMYGDMHICLWRGEWAWMALQWRRVTLSYSKSTHCKWTAAELRSVVLSCCIVFLYGYDEETWDSLRSIQAYTGSTIGQHVSRCDMRRYSPAGMKIQSPALSVLHVQGTWEMSAYLNILTRSMSSSERPAPTNGPYLPHTHHFKIIWCLFQRTVP